MRLLHTRCPNRAALALGGLLHLCLASCSLNLTEPARSTYPAVLRLDVAPTWSRDNQYVAYRRVVSSQDGPPGIYVVHRSGGRPRFITPASFFWPGELRFSPDGRQLVGIMDLYWVVLIDVETGDVRPIIYTENAPTSPDWSPDGRKLVYSRRFILSGQPFDSAAIRVYDLASGQETPLYHTGEVVYGTDTRWSPDGGWILCSQGTGQSEWITLVKPDGSELRRVTECIFGCEDIHWYRRPDTGMDGVVFREFPTDSIFFAAADGSVVVPWRRYGVWDDFSFDGHEMVISVFSPPDSVGLLFIQQVEDFAASSRRQITFFREPDPNVSSAGFVFYPTLRE